MMVPNKAISGKKPLGMSADYQSCCRVVDKSYLESNFIPYDQLQQDVCVHNDQYYQISLRKFPGNYLKFYYIFTVYFLLMASRPTILY